MKKRTKKKQTKSRRKFLTPEEIEERELRIRGKNLDNAIKLREIMAQTLEEKPDPEARRLLEKLDAEIAVEKRVVDLKIFERYRREVPRIIAHLNASIEKYKGEDLLREGAESYPEKLLAKTNVLLDDWEATLNEHDDLDEQIEDDFYLLHDAVIKARQKLDRKCRNARNTAKYSPETRDLYEKLAPGFLKMRADLSESYDETERTPLTADGTEYEMNEEYQDYLERLQAAYDLRDLLVNQLKKMKAERPGESFEELEQTIAELEAMLPNLEKVMKDEKESFQTLRRAQEKAETHFDDIENTLQDVIAENPHLILGTTKPKGQ